MIPNELATKKIAGLNLNFHAFQGDVLKVHTWSETEVKSSSQQSLRGNKRWLTDISSTATETTEIIVRSSDGKETNAKLYDSGVSVREGNNVILLYANDTMVGLWNKEQGLYWRVNTDWIVHYISPLQKFLGNAPIAFPFLLFIMGLIDIALGDSTLMGPLISSFGLVGFIFAIVHRKRTPKKRAAEIKKCIDSIFNRIIPQS